MNKKLINITLLLIFLFILGIRLYSSFNLPYFSDDESYFHLKHITHLVDEKEFMSFDPLSYGGREIVFPKLFHLFFALLSFGNINYLSFLSELLISLNFIIIYLISKELTNNSWAGIFSATLASLFPLLLNETLNNISIYNLVIPLLFLSIYFFMRLKEKKFQLLLIIAVFLLSFLHVSSYLLVLIFAVYLFILTAEGFSTSKIEKEAIIFSILIIILVSFIIYKKAFLLYGLNFIKQNIPTNILSVKFKQFDFMLLPFSLGLLPIICGGIGIIFSSLRAKSKNIHLFSALILSVLLLLTLKYIPFNFGIILLGISLSIFSSFFIIWFNSFLSRTKFSKYHNFFSLFIIFLVISLSFIPGINALRSIDSINQDYIEDFKWISENTPRNSKILTNVYEGNILTYFADRQNVIDSYFILAPKPHERIKDIDIIYSTKSTSTILNLLRKYNIDYIYYSDLTRRYYKIRDIPNLNGCLKKVRNNLYHLQCLK